jgi:hypothetical protein
MMYVSQYEMPAYHRAQGHDLVDTPRSIENSDLRTSKADESPLWNDTSRRGRSSPNSYMTNEQMPKLQVER